LIVTIDGTAGSGKSAAALEGASRRKIIHLDIRAMYRVVAMEAVK
jgi:cytidylate kinase